MPDAISIPVLRVDQWLREWNSVKFDPGQYRRKPPGEFFVTSMSAVHLRRLAGIRRRTLIRGERRNADTGVQRGHDEGRSDKIRDYVRYGYPWSELRPAQRKSDEFSDLRKPGWLPTAVVVNVLTAEDRREGQSVTPSDLVQVIAEGDRFEMRVPAATARDTWSPRELAPVEVIDGQHRLWAFSDDIPESFQVPVVLFVGLDISWQAYLFWSINITPVRINRSLAFDLYPLLRTEDWLERFEGHRVYRETRAQELTELLWSTPESPWYQRVNMLGEAGMVGVSQAAWVRSLMASYVKSWEGPGTVIGGLFGAPVGQHRTVLPWSRPQQAAFLMETWDAIRRAMRRSPPDWARDLPAIRQVEGIPARTERGMYSDQSLLSTDQGVRAVLQVSNDLTYVSAEALRLVEWNPRQDLSEDVLIAPLLRSVQQHPIGEFLSELGTSLAGYDWRTSAAPDLPEPLRQIKLGFRGSGGYKELRRQVLLHLASHGGKTAEAARRVAAALGYA